jgi:hypothetical protein
VLSIGTTDAMNGGSARKVSGRFGLTAARGSR